MKPSCLTFRSPTPATATPRQQRRGHPYSPCSSNRQYPSDYLEQLPIDYLVRSHALRKIAYSAFVLLNGLVISAFLLSAVTMLTP